MTRTEDSKIKRETPPPKIREDSEIMSAYSQIGENARRESSEWYVAVEINFKNEV